MVDWTKPIEAVGSEGNVVPASLDGFMKNRDGRKVSFNDGDGDWSWCVDESGLVMASKDWTIRNVVPTRKNASFHLFKRSGKWAYSGRGYLSEHVFKVFSNEDMRVQILNDNDEEMPGIRGNGDGYNVVVIGDENLPYGWPLHLNALGDDK